VFYGSAYLAVPRVTPHLYLRPKGEVGV